MWDRWKSQNPFENSVDFGFLPVNWGLYAKGTWGMREDTKDCEEMEGGKADIGGEWEKRER